MQDWFMRLFRCFIENNDQNILVSSSASTQVHVEAKTKFNRSTVNIYIFVRSCANWRLCSAIQSKSTWIIVWFLQENLGRFWGKYIRNITLMRLQSFKKSLHSNVQWTWRGSYAATEHRYCTIRLNFDTGRSSSQYLSQDMQLGAMLWMPRYGKLDFRSGKF